MLPVSVLSEVKNSESYYCVCKTFLTCCLFFASKSRPLDCFENNRSLSELQQCLHSPLPAQLFRCQSQTFQTDSDDAFTMLAHISAGNTFIPMPRFHRYKTELWNVNPLCRIEPQACRCIYKHAMERGWRLSGVLTPDVCGYFSSYQRHHAR